MTYIPCLPSVKKNSERESNSMAEPVYLYLSRSEFLVSFTDPHEQLPNVKSAFKFLNYGRSLEEISRFITFLGI